MSLSACSRDRLCSCDVLRICWVVFNRHWLYFFLLETSEMWMFGVVWESNELWTEWNEINWIRTSLLDHHFSQVTEIPTHRSFTWPTLIYPQNSEEPQESVWLSSYLIQCLSLLVWQPFRDKDNLLLLQFCVSWNDWCGQCGIRRRSFVGRVGSRFLKWCAEGLCVLPRIESRLINASWIVPSIWAIMGC